MFCLITSRGNKGSRQLETFPRLWHGFSRLSAVSQISGCLVEFSRKASVVSESTPNYVSHSANEYLHVPGVSRQEFNKAGAVSPRWAECVALRGVALRACIRVLSVPLGNDDDDDSLTLWARPLARAHSLVTLLLPPPSIPGATIARASVKCYPAPIVASRR